MEGDELRAAEEHIARLEEELLRLKDVKQELESLRARHQRLRRSANGRAAELLASPFRWLRRKAPERVADATTYEKWFSNHRLSAAKTPELVQAMKAWEYQPLVSILMATYDSNESWLEAALESVRAQIYPLWEVVLADDGTSRPGFGEALTRIGQSDARIRVLLPAKHGGISAALNRALAPARGEWIALLDHDDLLEPEALFRVIELLQGERHAQVIYSDEDKIVDDHFASPMLKPDWSPDLFLTHDYLGHFVALRRELVDQFRSEFDGAQDFDLLLRVSERAQHFCHIPRVLYHWRRTPHSTAHNIRRKPGALEAGRRAIAEHLARTGEAARVGVDWNTHAYRVRRNISDVKISIVTAPGSSPEAEDRIRSQTDFPALEFVTAPMKGDGDLILLLDADLEAMERSWLRALSEYLSNERIGAIGPRLLNPDGTIESAGYVLMPDGMAQPAFASSKRHDPGANRQLQTARNYSALTAACLLTRRDLFARFGSSVGTERSRICAGVEYCLRLRDAGWRVVSIPYADLRRGKTVWTSVGDCRDLAQRWPTIFQRDPFYNPNLSRAAADFSLGAMK